MVTVYRPSNRAAGLSANRNRVCRLLFQQPDAVVSGPLTCAPLSAPPPSCFTPSCASFTCLLPLEPKLKKKLTLVVFGAMRPRASVVGFLAAPSLKSSFWRLWSTWVPQTALEHILRLHRANDLWTRLVKSKTAQSETEPHSETKPACPTRFDCVTSVFTSTLLFFGKKTNRRCFQITKREITFFASSSFVRSSSKVAMQIFSWLRVYCWELDGSQLKLSSGKLHLNSDVHLQRTGITYCPERSSLAGKAASIGTEPLHHSFARRRVS